MKKREVFAGKSVFVRVSTGVIDRHLFSLLFFFTRCGYRVYIRPTLRVLVSYARNEFTKLLFQTDNIALGCFKPRGASIFLSDRRRRHAVRLSADYFAPSAGSSIHIPMAMHPRMYSGGFYEKSPALSKNDKRPITIFFAGYFRRGWYSHEYVKEYYKKSTRMELFDMLMRRFGDAVHIPQRKEELSKNAKRKILIVDTTHFQIPMGELLEMYSVSRFFLAFSGIHKPLCHNIVEAMSAGCIPIVEFPEFFLPPLKDGENCLSFSGEQEFVSAINGALRMDAKRVASMREAVIGYYSEHLSPSGVIGSIESKLPVLKTIYINAGITKKLLEKRLGKRLRKRNAEPLYFEKRRF